jgi:hypothetical protein
MNQLLIGKILLIGAFQAFFLAALLIKKREKALHDFIIGAWLIFVYINPKVPHSSIEKYTTKSTMNGNFPFIKYGQYVYKTRDNNQEPS